MGSNLEPAWLRTAAGEEKSAGDRAEYTYDKNGRTTKISGPAGHETLNEYDKRGNLTTKKQKQPFFTILL